MPNKPLLPDRRDRDLFLADLSDVAPKGDIGSMEHPVFSLSTKPDHRTLQYNRDDIEITIAPSAYGLATVHDRDLLIYCMSKLIAAMNDGQKPKQTIRFSAHDMLRMTNRQTSGRGYELLRACLRRLAGTRIETNIKQGGEEVTKGFGLIENYEIVKESRNGQMLELEVKLSDWLFDAVKNFHVLTLHRDYFRLRKPLERRLYELARKHCGEQSSWRIATKSLHAKCGSGSKLNGFRRNLRSIIDDDSQHNHMPDYRFLLDDDDMVTVVPKVDLAEDLQISPNTLEAARALVPGVDVYALEAEWRDSAARSKQRIRSPDRHFLGFCQKRVSRA